MTETLSQTLAAYKAWLDRQPLATKTRMAYRLQVHQYGAYLALRSPTADDPFYTPFGLGECIALNLDDLRISARQGTVIMRSGKGDIYREVPLNAQVREALKTWLKERNTRFPRTFDLVVFLNRSGKWLSARSSDQNVRRIGADTHLELSAHVLRHTCLTNLVRCGNDLILIAEMAGHKHLETTWRSRFPSLFLFRGN